MKRVDTRHLGFFDASKTVSTYMLLLGEWGVRKAWCASSVSTRFIGILVDMNEPVTMVSNEEG